MISCLLCSRRLCLSNVSFSKPIYQSMLLNSSKNRINFLSNYYCKNAEDTLNVSASVDQTTNAFKEIYRFPGIRLGFFLHKLKWQQTILAAVSLPSSIILYYFGLIDSKWTVGVIVPGKYETLCKENSIRLPTGIFLALNLYSTSFLFQNAVGFLYLSKDGTTLKISYLDFWGKRINEEIPVKDVVPFLDAPRPPTDFFYKQLLFYSSDKAKLKLYLKLGQITDKEKFDKVFGPLE